MPKEELTVNQNLAAKGAWAIETPGIGGQTVIPERGCGQSVAGPASACVNIFDGNAANGTNLTACIFNATRLNLDMGIQTVPPEGHFVRIDRGGRNVPGKHGADAADSRV